MRRRSRPCRKGQSLSSDHCLRRVCAKWARGGRAAGKPVIAFSTDTSTAGPELFLLSFLIESYVDRIVDFAASKGEKSIAALIPDNDYGRVAESDFQQAAARDNIRVMTIEHYQPQTMASAVQKIAALHDQIDLLFIPERADAMQAMSRALTAAGSTENMCRSSAPVFGTTRAS